MKDQINNINKNGQDGIKVEDGVKREDGSKIKDDKIIDDVGYFYIVDEYKNLIYKILKFELINGDLHLTNCDNRKIGLSKIVNKNLVQKNINTNNSLILRNPFKI